MHISQKLSIAGIEQKKHTLVLSYTVDDHSFQTTIDYQDVDFEKLEQQFGKEALNRLNFHIAFIEALKYCSLAPKYFDITPWSHFVNKDLLQLFQTLYTNIYAQHRYENRLEQYTGPLFLFTSADTSFENLKLTSDKKLLVSCGGGKDSLVTMKLVERAHLPYGIFQYSHSVYGDAQHQHKLIDPLVGISQGKAQHKIDVHDDFFTGNILKHFKGKLTTLCGAETPSGVFQAIPVMMMHHYSQLCLGHEKSADVGNFHWKAEDREVNHQWGKSYEAEMVINQYIQKRLLKNFHYFSILKPIHDYLIFQLLKQDQEHFKLTSSCNVKKPWCMRCAKCVYVWLKAQAYLDQELLPEEFSENLFDVDEVKDMFLQMMGHSGHKPFECIGEIGEVQLALYYCKQKGITGKVLDIFEQDVLPSIDIAALEKKYSEVDQKNHALPEFVAKGVWEQFNSARAR